MKIYVGNLSYEVTEDDLRQAFAAFGPVESVAIIKDRSTGQSKGFGFVEMPSKEEGQAAITGMNGKEIKGRTLNVNEALPRTEKPGGGGGRGGYGGGGGAAAAAVDMAAVAAVAAAVAAVDMAAVAAVAAAVVDMAAVAAPATDK